MEVNLRALQERARESDALRRFHEVGGLLRGQGNSSGEDAVEWLKALCRELSIPPLSAHGVTREHSEELVEKAQKASSMKGNPIRLTSTELAEILERAI